jgi:hypothetical protein
MGILDFLPTVAKIIDKIIPDPAAKAAAQLELVKLTQSGELAQLDADVKLATGQTDVNKIEAASTNTFVSGWRPFIGWVCGLGLSSQFIIGPLLTWGATLVGHPTTFPTLDLSTLTTLLFGMLGLGAMRTVEKINGVAAK